MHGKAQLDHLVAALYKGRRIEQLPETEPLAGEIARQGVRAFVREHSLDLSIEVLPQLPLPGKAQKLPVRHGTPEKVGKSGSQGKFIDQVNGLRIVRTGLDLAAEQEGWRDQDGL